MYTEKYLKARFLEDLLKKSRVTEVKDNMRIVVELPPEIQSEEELQDCIDVFQEFVGERNIKFLLVPTDTKVRIGKDVVD
jgi:hypothetical protein